MSDVYTSSELIDSIKARASIPVNQNTYQVSDLLRFASEEMKLGIVPSIMSLHEDFFMFEHEVDAVGGQLEYTIPSRAVGNKLNDVQIKYNDNNYQETTRISIGKRFDTNQFSGLRQFYVKNNKVVFRGMETAPNYKIVFVFYIKPSSLVEENRVGIITGINRTTGEIVLNDIPDNFGSSVKYDFYKATSPSSLLKIDISSVSINQNSKTVTFNPDNIPSDLEIGDHLSQAGEACIPQIPSDVHPMLAQMVACRVLEGQTDTEALTNAKVKLAEMTNAAGIILDNRVDSAPVKLVNRHGALNSAMSSKRFGRRR